MEAKSAKQFNITGPCVPEKHYMLPVLPRLPGVNEMIDNENYFILHAPRQSGKTTFIKALTEKINKDSQRYALYCSLAILREATDKIEAIDLIVSRINWSIKYSSVDTIKHKVFSYDTLSGMSSPDTKIQEILTILCLDLDKPVVVFFDEADSLIGPGLLTFLTQIRDGFINRNDLGNKFPSSLALIGMRNIRDYLSTNHPDSVGGHLASPFNIVTKKMTLANFTEREIGALYRQHTLATGQVFEDSAIAKAWYWSEGQPWLVNALAREVVTEQLNNDFSVTITKDHIDEAAEILIKRRDTHIDSLLERLKEPRVIKVMDFVFAGTKGKNIPIDSDDRQYCIDLGLVIKNDDQSLRPANKIYQEVIFRKITDQIEYILTINQHKNMWTDGKVLFISNLLKEFQKFWRHDSRSFPSRYKDFAASKYDEATYTFMLLAYLQKIINSGGSVHRQFSEGRGAIDITAIYNGHEYLIEAKLNEKYFSLEDSLKQLSGYMDTAGTNEAWLVIFDRDLEKSWDEKIYWKTQEYNGKTIHVVGC
ncbi:MAG: AAA-like domain-containing protein [Deltaproteobacteria bacterium]|jgi:hypothetical protein|nr:AAA-like domain-containing protein [Deltaproteobacteria bacterium]